MSTTFSWSRSNAKLRKTQAALRSQGERATIVSFNLPAFASESGRRVCPGAGDCRHYCYAQQGRFVLSAVRRVREENLAKVLAARESLADQLVADLNAMPSVTHVRIHDSGDFFAPWYLRSWIEAADRCPGRTLYAYTKSHALVPWEAVPSNLVLVQSFGGQRDAEIDLGRPHARVFGSQAEIALAGYVDGSETDMPAIKGERRIGLAYHGAKSRYRTETLDGAGTESTTTSALR